MKISKDGYYCFGCHEHGNIFGFVMKLFNLDFRQACDKLNFDFGLNIPTHTHLSKQDKIRMAEEKKRRDNEKFIAETMLKYKNSCIDELRTRQERIFDKMEEIKPVLYDGNKFLFNMTEDEDFENLCEEFLALKKNYDIIDFNITLYEMADLERLKRLYHLSNGKLKIQEIF